MLVDHHFFAVFHGNLFKKMSGTFEDVWVHISCVVGLEDVQLLNRVFCGLVLWSGGPFHAERWFRPLPKADKKSIFEVYLLKVEYPKPKQRIGTQRFDHLWFGIVYVLLVTATAWVQCFCKMWMTHQYISVIRSLVIHHMNRAWMQLYAFRWLSTILGDHSPSVLFLLLCCFLVLHLGRV